MITQSFIRSYPPYVYYVKFEPRAPFSFKYLNLVIYLFYSFMKDNSLNLISDEDIAELQTNLVLSYNL